MSTSGLVLTAIGEDPVPSRVALMTLNRPEARNALSTDMLAALSAALAAVEADDGVDVVVLTGAGTAFCAGLDLKQMAATGANLQPSAGRPWPHLKKPMIAAVNGPAITGGLELALNCDFVVASTDAVFADTHTRVGLVPFWGLTVLLPAAIGTRNARYMSLTGRLVSAEEALRMGLVAAVVPAADLLSTVLTMADEIVSADQAATRMMAAEYRRNSVSAEAFDAEVKMAERFLQGGIKAEVIERRRKDIMARNRTAMG